MKYVVFAVGVESDETHIKEEFTSELKAWKFLIQNACDYQFDNGGKLSGHVGVNQIMHTDPNGERISFYIST